MDIVFYSKATVLNHKKRKGYIYHWSMKVPPKRFKAGERIFFAVDGYVVGSFKCKEFNPKDQIETLVWEPESWENLKPKIKLDRRHWQGFRYRWWRIKRMGEKNERAVNKKM